MLSLNVCNPAVEIATRIALNSGGGRASWLWLSMDYGLDGSSARSNRRTAGHIKDYPE
jgi:hypothetical protein